MAALKSFVVCFLMLPLSVACANQTAYHTMLYVKILNYTNTGTLQRSGGNMHVSTSGSGGNMPVSTPGSDSCCYKMPLQNCTHFFKTVFSICIESKCDTYLFNITYNYGTGRIYDENYGVERLNVQSIKDQTINIDVTEIKKNIRTGSSIVFKIDSFATKYSRPPSGSFWLSRMYPLRLQNNASSIDLQITAFCESNWYNPRQNCAENIQSNNLQSVHYNFGNRTFDAELDCTTEETSKITFITKRPYKFTKQILEAQLSRFIADRVCSSIAVDVTIYIYSVRYDSNLLRVVFTSHCNMHNSSLLSIANKYIEVSDLKLNQALMFLSSYEERQYFIDPVLRDDFSSAQNLGNFQLLLRLKRFENSNNIYFTNDFRGLTKHNCPVGGCTPSFHFTYQGVEHILRKYSPATNLMDCFGNLVDESNPTEKTNNTLFWHSSKTWNTHDSIKLEIYQNDNNKEPIVIMDIKLDNVDVVSSNYLLARPILISKTIDFTNVSVDIEIMVWCSTGFYGKACNETCPTDNINCNIGQCIDLHTINQDASSLQIDYHCRKGTCNNGVCQCPNGFAGDSCNVVSNYILPYNTTYHFLDDTISNTTCEDGYKNFNCDERDFCYNNLCKHGRCSNDVNIYSCVCDDGFEGLNCDRNIDYCNTVPCQNNATCLDEQTNYTCICRPGYTGLNCEEDINYCTNNTCLNHAICIEEQTNYTCICHPGYTGLNCEADINYCTTNTCQNNATCLEEQTNYTCICQPGFTGLNCEIDINYCTNDTCLNHAICIEEQTNYTCICQPGYAGLNCEVDINYCTNNTCHNNAICIEEQTNYTCICQPGYTGLNCEEDINFCTNNTCQNNATCIEEQTNYTCICQPGYTGLNCEVDINYCTNNTCLNNATCIEEQTHYTCICQPGYTGLNCEVDINYCTNNTCLNNAICIEEQTQYTCICQPGYTGLNCEVDIDYCTNNTCHNNATCLEEQTNYTCICQPGYTGLNCEIDINYCTNNTCLNNATCIDEQTNFKCLCQPGYIGMNCENYTEICSEELCKNNGTCQVIDGSLICQCPFGFEGKHCESVSNSSLQTRDAIDAGCSGSGWNITVNITLLKQLDPVIVLNNIHFGDNACGGKEVGNLLLFQQGFQECLTNKQISGNMLLYINDLFYVVYDPINPYIIRRHEWTFTVQCDVDRNEAASSHVHHDANTQHIEVSGQYRIDLSFYKDVNFMHELPGNPLHINLGDDIYVKVYTTANDWTTKMRLHTCYTTPNDAAGKNMTYFIIKNGCEVDSNTHIISQSTHETKFVFQDFEYSTNREGLDIHCNATFCDTKDYSPGCAQSCVLP